MSTPNNRGEPGYRLAREERDPAVVSSNSVVRGATRSSRWVARSSTAVHVIVQLRLVPTWAWA